MKRRILFVHQNFPGQFGHVAKALAAAGHEVVALGINTREIPGVKCLRYTVKPPERPATGLAQDYEVKVVRGMACAMAMDDLKRILAAREPLYRKADAVVDTSGADPAHSLRELKELARA